MSSNLSSSSTAHTHTPAAPVETLTIHGEAEARAAHANGCNGTAVGILCFANGIDYSHARAIVATWGKVGESRRGGEECDE